MAIATHANRERKVTVAARVPPELARAVAELADVGNRTLSREVASAIAEHVERSASSGSLAEPAERSAPGSPAVEAQTLAGLEKSR
jgi:predicted transcriptional regulator